MGLKKYIVALVVIYVLSSLQFFIRKLFIVSRLVIYSEAVLDGLKLLKKSQCIH